jgi:hypothetical protein
MPLPSSNVSHPKRTLDIQVFWPPEAVKRGLRERTTHSNRNPAVADGVVRLCDVRVKELFSQTENMAECWGEGEEAACDLNGSFSQTC